MSSMEKETPFMISCCLMIWVSYSMMRILFFIFYFYSLAVFPSLLSGVWFPCSELNLLIALVILYTIHDSTLFLLEVGKERCTKWSCIPDLYIDDNYIFFVASHFLNNSNCWFIFFFHCHWPNGLKSSFRDHMKNASFFCLYRRKSEGTACHLYRLSLLTLLL